MLETAVRAERQRDIDAAPERVWNLLASSAAWSLRPGRFALDVTGAPADAGRLLVSVGGSTAAGCEVWQAAEDEPGRVIRWQLHSAARSRRRLVKLSVRPAGPGATALISVGELVPRWSAADARRRWQHELGAWLDAVQAAAEGRMPWPGAGIPADIVSARTAFPAIKASVTASASALIAAPPGAVWDVVWSPETTVLTDWATLAAGHVPGSPYQQVGEMQYFVRRQPGGRLTADVIVVQELDDQRRALTRDLDPPHTQMDHLVTADSHGTRFTLTWIVPVAGLTLSTGEARRQVETYVRTAVTTYKDLIETTGRA